MSRALRWSDEQLAAHHYRMRSTVNAPGPVPVIDDGMNKTESAYAQMLEFQRLGGDVLAFDFEAIKLRLAGNTFYTPDFFVTLPTHFEFHEVKGFWRDDARVKIKVAAEQFPHFGFLAVTKVKGEWSYERFSP